MRVLVVTNMYPSPGDPMTGIFVEAQVESLRRLGVRADVQVIRGRRSKLEYLAAIGRLHARLRRTSYDVVHAHYGLSGFVAVQQRRAPVCVSFCGSDLLGIPDTNGRETARGRAQVVLSRLAAARAGKVIVKSRQLGLALGGRRDFAVIPNGVDLSLFAPIDRGEARRALGISDGDPRVLWVGRTRSSEKRFDRAEAAMRALAARRPDVKLLVLEGRPQREVAQAMSAADCLLMTSALEGSPNVVKEAMACNLPVVSTRVGDVEELFGRNPACILSDGTPHDLASGIERAIAMGRSNGRAAVEALSLESVARRVLSIYEELA